MKAKASGQAEQKPPVADNRPEVRTGTQDREGVLPWVIGKEHLTLILHNDTYVQFYTL